MRNLVLSALILASAFQAAVGDKLKAVMVAFILFISGLYADDDKARMERNKIFKKSASELTTEAPKTVRAVQQSSVVKTEGEYGVGDFFIELLQLATQKNPQLTAEMIQVGQEYLKEDGAKPDDLFKAPETNSVSNHSPSK
jgi:hypothetical protein